MEPNVWPVCIKENFFIYYSVVFKQKHVNNAENFFKNDRCSSSFILQSMVQDV